MLVGILPGLPYLGFSPLCISAVNEFKILNFGLFIASNTTSLFIKIFFLGEKLKSDREKVKLLFEIGKFIFCH